MSLSLEQVGAVLLALVILFAAGRLWYALVEMVKDAIARRFFSGKREPWHPLPPDEGNSRRSARYCLTAASSCGIIKPTRRGGFSMKTIITIGRQFGSGGKEIGIRVAKELGIPFYDKELLQEAAKKSGLCEKIFENFDERPKSLLYSIAMDSYMFALPGSGVGDSLEQQVYLATFNTIRHIADQGPCVIIGRCADYALADYPNHLSLFISAPLEVRIQRVAQRQNLTPEKARQLILKTDKRRASYYEYYSSKKWGSVDSYHFCIDSSYLGLGRTVELIQAMVAHKEHPIPSPTEEDPTRPRT